MTDDQMKLRRQIRLQRFIIFLLTVVLSAMVVTTYVPLPVRQRNTAKAVLGAEAGTSTTYLPMVVQPPKPYVYTFDGEPAAPESWQPGTWDIQVHSRDRNTWQAPEPMAAEHGMDCGAPPATHHIDSYDHTVFICRNHVMTSLNASAYGVIYLTPNQLVDFSGGEAVVRWEMSTLRTSERDWIDLWITPYEDNLALPLQDWLPDLQGEARRALHVGMTAFNGMSVFRASAIKDFQATEIEGCWWCTIEQNFQEQGTETSASRRDVFELRLSKTHVKFWMPKYNLVWIDKDIPELDWAQGVVQFGHHSYTPMKDCYKPNGCTPNTWHWDNVQIAPSRPFTIMRANKRSVNKAANSMVTFGHAAPANAHLRFAAHGKNIEVSFDGGNQWQAAEKQREKKNDDGHFHSYWTPIPEGAAAVRIRAQGIPDGEWMARDLAIWSLNTTTSSPR